MKNPVEIEHLAQLINSLANIGCHLETDNYGQIIIYTGVCQDDDGCLHPIEYDDEGLTAYEVEMLIEEEG